MRVMRQFHRILVDQEDAASFKEGEEVTFLRWVSEGMETEGVTEGGRKGEIKRWKEREK
jgi:hypothetical protein